MGTTLAEIKTKGWNALVKELGYSGATKFILLYETGEGDYTKERKKIFKDITIDDIDKEIKQGKETGRHKP
jgi:hypothetical protein